MLIFESDDMQKHLFFFVPSPSVFMHHVFVIICWPFLETILIQIKTKKLNLQKSEVFVVPVVCWHPSSI